MNGARFLALGDSYTVGEGVAAAEAWPARLAADVRARGIPLADPQVVARTGWTCDDLADGIRAAAPRGPYPLVSLLIGVNDQYRSGTPAAYEQRFTPLLRRAADLAGGRSGRVLVLSIPDWGVSPAADGRDRAAIAGSIDAFNAVNLAAARSMGARYVDVTASSRRFAAPADFAADGLHPAAPVHAAWAQLALEAAVAALRV